MTKLTYEEYHKIDNTREFCYVHGIKGFVWGDIYRLKGHPPDGKLEDYELYCKWFDLYNSPLFQAMREDEV